MNSKRKHRTGTMASDRRDVTAVGEEQAGPPAPDFIMARLASRIHELETMFETLTDGICCYDAAGAITYMNTALRTLLGIDDSASEASNPLLFPGDIQGRLLPREQWPVSRLLRGESLVGAVADIMLSLPGGREVFLNVSGAPMLDANGQIVGAITALRDVTERRQLELRTRDVLSSLLAMAEALVQEPTILEELPREIQESRLPLPAIVGQRLAELTCDILGCMRISFTSVEPETGVMHPIAVVGLSPEYERQWWLDLQDSMLDDYFAPPVLARLRADEEVLIDFTTESFTRRSNYGTRAMFVMPICMNERLIGILGVEHRKITHHYTEEETGLIRTVSRLAALIIIQERIRLEKIQARAGELALKEVNRRMNEFLGIASHELRTPLTVIQANVQLAERQLKRLDQHGVMLSKQLEMFHEQIEQADEQAHVMNRLISDLLDIARTEDGTLEMHLVSCDLMTIVSEAVKEIQLTEPDRQVLLESAYERSVPIVADPTRIKQVVMNYLTNALRYSAENRPVEVEVRARGIEAYVAVRDQGIGLSEEEQEHIWERFYRGEGSSTQGGFGLGLHICKLIVLWHQGRLGVQSMPGKGSTFWFTLPLPDV